MSWHKMTLKVIDVLALLGHRCLGTYYLILNTICVIFFVDTYYMCGINKPNVNI